MHEIPRFVRYPLPVRARIFGTEVTAAEHLAICERCRKINCGYPKQRRLFIARKARGTGKQCSRSNSYTTRKHFPENYFFEKERSENARLNCSPRDCWPPCARIPDLSLSHARDFPTAHPCLLVLKNKFNFSSAFPPFSPQPSETIRF